MCTAIAAQFILDALAARIKNLSIFTAHDVTTDARKATKATKATNDNIKHGDTRRILSNEFHTNQMPGYDVEPLELNNGQIARCYFPDGKSANEHPAAMNPFNAQSAPTSTPINSSVAQAVTVSNVKKGGSVKDGSGYICTETDRGVVNIPDVIVKGVTPNGGSYDIQLQNGSVVYKAPDGKGRLRIASSKLGGGDKFRLEVVNNTITVEQI